MKRAILVSLAFVISRADGVVDSVVTPFGADERDVVVLQNDGYAEAGGPAFVQMGFVTGEKAGVWLKVPAGIRKFKVDHFRALIGGARNESSRTQVFFSMGVVGPEAYTPGIPREIENAANITPGPYWNDIPAMGADGKVLQCVTAGGLIGAAIEFTHDGVPSVYRDADGISNPKANTLFAVPGGWNYSIVFGLQGDWVLRIVGHEAKPGECP